MENSEGENNELDLKVERGKKLEKEEDRERERVS